MAEPGQQLAESRVSHESFSYEDEHRRKKQPQRPSHRGVGNDAMSKALNQISRSPFMHRIEGAKLPRRFNQPTFTIYNGKTDPVEHVSHFNQRIAVYSRDEALMCKVFPSSLGPVAMRWFDNLKADSGNSYQELTQAFGSHFVTCRRVARPLSSLLSLSMHEGETLKAYSDRYWEMFNDMEGNFDAMALDTFKLGLLTDHGLRTSLSDKPDRKDFRSDRYNNNKPRRDFAGQSGSTNAQAVNAVFKEPVHQVLEKIKNESFFRWPSKMVGNLERRNHNLYCQYHQDHGHATEDCRSLWDHLDQLVREGRLRYLLHHSSGRGGQVNFGSEKSDSTKPPLGIINVIFVAPGRTGSWPSKVMSVARLPVGDIGPDPRSSRPAVSPVLDFSDEDKAGTIQPHDDALVVTLRIGRYDVKRVMVDQGSAVEIMYPDLYKGLNLKLDNLTPYCSPLVSFEGRMVTPKGQIRLPVQTGSEVVEVDFIVVDVYSPYSAIVARPWLHTLGVVSSTLHQKVKYPFEGRVFEIRRDQTSARQCLEVAI
ncbi:uncharacterized protein LOC136066358 [Quercus suber]|uniref:uncharacterized protein LOC136066358 n=1 Tax=Quercus suber TaxID=58331 RepID=UPI0032DF5DE5